MSWSWLELNSAELRPSRNWVWDQFKNVLLKGSYDAFLKIIILCIWCNRICWHALMFKKHYFSNTVHYCRSAMPRLSQTHCFLQSPSFRQAQSALIGQLAQCIVTGRTPQALVGNVTSLSIIASFSFRNKSKRQLIMSLVLPSVQAWEGNRVTWQTQWWSSYVFAVHKPRLRKLTPLWCDPVSLSHTRRAKRRIWAVNGKYLN